MTAKKEKKKEKISNKTGKKIRKTDYRITAEEDRWNRVTPASG